MHTTMSYNYESSEDDGNDNWISGVVEEEYEVDEEEEVDEEDEEVDEEVDEEEEEGEANVSIALDDWTPLPILVSIL